ncbi:orotidine-5'-phosphate decarboxylase [Aquibacillus salsiterrae]|uniref:Orotidine 5'-phosphate decarboxylase n=1 Tax=Aquibacillus salsiterrae TaxID=2950439 RepID=A0A9X4AE70_9BACI|nr:orotidine-5'-phosphate decarboxylase [Aquibacillus salsiterrae]MDC3416452.1 orotidine-5'-phosphate decarboxylase [Aquibacillus salsiterrae]
MQTPIYLALDFASGKEALGFIRNNELKGIPIKIGMELFYKEGPAIVDAFKQDNHPIFLDLKLHDIPTTVKKAMKNVAILGVDMVNVHAFGGSEMIRAAKEGLLAGTNQKVPKLLAVTLLTSMDEATLNNELHVTTGVETTVVALGELANNNGADGVVCSVHEVPMIKAACGHEFLTVTPGIRLTESASHDQKRIATPKVAHQNGADHIVIGRSVTQAPNPKKAYEQAVEEWNHVTSN